MKDNLMDVFIKKIDEMRFLGLDDLFIKKKQIKRAYDELEFSEKEIYKWYFFYQLCLVRWRNKEKIGIKDAFWDYLNGKTSPEQINGIYLEYCNYKDKNV